jgi:DNA helicase-2/ATP-dependent DNA helicase PcrA
MNLSEEQKEAVFHIGNVFVTACPGSGKTRALTSRIASSALAIEYPSERVLGLTFTNRAAEEIQSRIELCEGIDNTKVWIGTIHAFALEWIIRPFAGYIQQLKHGFDLADEYEVEKIVGTLKREHGMNYFDSINKTYNKQGLVINNDPVAELVEKKYREILIQSKKIDFDQILYFAYLLLTSRPDIAITLGAIFRSICVDEMQDTQELQYAILSCIHNQSLRKPRLFFVGDENQAIYQGIGGISKTLEELNIEFVGGEFKKFHFSDNYRSTQRIIDYFSFYRMHPKIVSKADYASLQGKIVFANRVVHYKDLGEYISKIIKTELDAGVAQNQICIIGPQWSSLRALSRKLVSILPNIRFDAPILSPFYGHQDNLWLVVSKLILTTPSGRMYSTRMRWASDLKKQLSVYSNEAQQRLELNI